VEQEAVVIGRNVSGAAETDRHSVSAAFMQWFRFVVGPKVGGTMNCWSRSINIWGDQSQW